MSDKHNNAHRAKKRSFQVMLDQSESGLLDAIKSLMGIDSNKQLLIELLKKQAQGDLPADSQIQLRLNSQQKEGYVKAAQAEGLTKTNAAENCEINTGSHNHGIEKPPHLKYDDF